MRTTVKNGVVRSAGKMRVAIAVFIIFIVNCVGNNAALGQSRITVFSLIVGAVEREYSTSGGKTMEDIEIYIKESKDKDNPYFLLTSYDQVILEPEFAIIMPNLTPAWGYIRGNPINESLDSLDYLANFPISREFQQTAIIFFNNSRNRAVRAGILLALRFVPLDIQTSLFLATTLRNSQDKNLRMAALFALLPSSPVKAQIGRSQFDVDAILSALQFMLDTGARPQTFLLILAIVSESPFIGSKDAVPIAKRLLPVTAIDTDFNEAMNFYKKRFFSR